MCLSSISSDNDILFKSRNSDDHHLNVHDGKQFKFSIEIYQKNFKP